MQYALYIIIVYIKTHTGYHHMSSKVISYAPESIVRGGSVYK